MWGEALAVLERADRLHRHFFTSGAPHGAPAGVPVSVPNWEPPVDIVQAEDELRIHIALPGVPADGFTLARDDDELVVSALRPFPCRESGTHIHRVEIPYGRFERRLPLPMNEMELAGKHLADGVLTLTFRRKDGA